MHIKLAKIADIQYGTYAKALEDGDVKYLHAGHFDNFTRLSQFSDSFIELDGKLSKFLLANNDVIFAAKGSRNFAWAYKSEFGQCVPSSLFYILRTDPSKILGEYLAHYLNSERVQYIIKQMLTGGGTPSIPKKEFNELEIEIPSIETQQKIIELARLIDEDIQLTNDLLILKKNLKKGLITKMIMNQSL